MEYSEIQMRVLRKIENTKEEITHSLQEVVQIPSVVGSEGKGQDYMETLYRSLGLEVIRFQPDIEKVRNHPAFVDTEMPYEDKPNIIGTLLGDLNSPSIILNGHIDVVSPEPVHAWTHDPWGAEIEGDKMYGRGTGDMKAGLVANFFALKGILEAGIKPKGKVMLQSVIDEEAGGAGGTLSCLMEGYTADGMICTEPHNLNVTVAHAGVNYFRIKVRGRPVMPGRPTLESMQLERCTPSIKPWLISMEREVGKCISPFLRRVPEDLAISMSGP